MTETIRCDICGVPATKYFGNNNSLPICDNLVCYQVAQEEINLLLAELSEGNVEEKWYE